MAEEIKPITHSPVIVADAHPVSKSAEVFDFPEAMRRIAAGECITKKEWNDENYYGLLKDGFLMFHKPDGKYYIWKVSDGDMNGDDYYLVGVEQVAVK